VRGIAAIGLLSLCVLMVMLHRQHRQLAEQDRERALVRRFGPNTAPTDEVVGPKFFIVVTVECFDTEHGVLPQCVKVEEDFSAYDTNHDFGKPVRVCLFPNGEYSLCSAMPLERDTTKTEQAGAPFVAELPVVAAGVL